MRLTIAALLLTATASLLPAPRPTSASSAVRASGLDTAFIKVPSWRFVGPDGNRVIAVAGVPGEYKTYYAGAASGGLFKSTNGGIRWTPVTDSLRVASVSAIAVAPSDPNVVWFGTGETFLRSNVSIGDGIYRSTDAGQHWARMSLENTGRIGRVLIHPTNADIVYAAAQGHGYGPQADRGLRLHRVLRDAQPRGDLLLRKTVDPPQGDHLAAARGEGLDGVGQKFELLRAGDRLRDIGALIGDVPRRAFR